LRSCDGIGNAVALIKLLSINNKSEPDKKVKKYYDEDAGYNG